MQQEFISIMEVWKLEREIRLAGFEPEGASQVETMTVTEYADRLSIVRKNNPGALEYLTS